MGNCDYNEMTENIADAMKKIMDEQYAEWDGMLLDQFVSDHSGGGKCDHNATEMRPDCDHPLTLEQLREMDGEPVYIIFLPDVTGEKLQFWALVDVDTFGDVNLTNNLGGSSPYEEAMENIEAIYRRPPEGEEG